jgi:hypothetical protein
VPSSQIQKKKEEVSKLREINLIHLERFVPPFQVDNQDKRHHDDDDDDDGEEEEEEDAGSKRARRDSSSSVVIFYLIYVGPKG